MIQSTTASIMEVVADQLNITIPTNPSIQGPDFGRKDINDGAQYVRDELIEGVKNELATLMQPHANYTLSNATDYNVTIVREELSHMGIGHVSWNDTVCEGSRTVMTSASFWQLLTGSEEGTVFLAILAVAG